MDQTLNDVSLKELVESFNELNQIKRKRREAVRRYFQTENGRQKNLECNRRYYWRQKEKKRLAKLAADQKDENVKVEA